MSKSLKLKQSPKHIKPSFIIRTIFGVKKYLNITSERPTRKEDKKTILGDGACKIDIDGVNCTLNINEI